MEQFVNTSTSKYKPNSIALVFYALVLVLWAGRSLAQTNAAGIPVDDPELYFGFFSFRMQVQSDINASDTDRGTKLHAAVARHLNLDDSDFVAAGVVADSVLKKLEVITHMARSYYSGELAAGRRPPRAKLSEFQQQRVAALRGGMDDLRNKLSPAGWRALNAYINGEYRSRIVRKELTSAQQ